MEFRKTLLVATVIIAAIMELIDVSIVNVALSQMSGNLGSTLEDTAWVITSYAIANVIIIPITSFLANKLGRKNYYVGSIIAFTFFSFMCGQATNIWMLVAFRFFQGIGGGALLSVSQAIVFENFPKEKQGIASAIFGIGVFIGPTIGPTLGGIITESYSWPWIFYINIPIGILVTILSILLLDKSTDKIVPDLKIDWIGIALLCIGVGSLQTVLERGESEDWFESKFIIILSILAILGSIFFVVWELKAKNPVVNLKVLKSKSLSIAAFMTFVSGIGMFSSIFLTPVFAQRLLNFTPTQAGMLLLPGSIIAIFGLIISAKLLQKGVSPVVIIAIGFSLFILFSWNMSQLNLDAGFTDISIPLIYRALGIALMTVPLTTLAISGLEPKDIPQGAALNNMMRQLGGSLGIAIANTLLITHTAKHRGDLLVNVNEYNPAYTERLNNYTQYFLSKGSSLQEATNKALKTIDITVGKQSSLLSFMDSFLFIGFIFLISMMSLFLVIKQKKKNNIIITSDH